jgi:hypothetical protein
MKIPESLSPPQSAKTDSSVKNSDNELEYGDILETAKGSTTQVEVRELDTATRGRDLRRKLAGRQWLL